MQKPKKRRFIKVSVPFPVADYADLQAQAIEHGRSKGKELLEVWYARFVRVVAGRTRS